MAMSAKLPLGAESGAESAIARGVSEWTAVRIKGDIEVRDPVQDEIMLCSCKAIDIF
jgi:hypothetical protein